MGLLSSRCWPSPASIIIPGAIVWKPHLRACASFRICLPHLSRLPAEHTQPSPLARTSLNEALKDTGNSLRFRKNLYPTDTTPAPSSPGPASRKPSCHEPCEGELRAIEDGMPKSHHIRISNILPGASQPCSHRRKPEAHGLLSCPAWSSHWQDLCAGHALGWVTNALLSWMQWACSFPLLGSPLPWLIIPWNLLWLGDWACAPGLCPKCTNSDCLGYQACPRAEHRAWGSTCCPEMFFFFFS